MTISPAVSMWLNILLAALTGVGTVAATDPTIQKIVYASGLAATIFNAVLHSMSSSSPGPVAKALTKQQPLTRGP